jgi:hypothetical protein
VRYRSALTSLWVCLFAIGASCEGGISFYVYNATGRRVVAKYGEGNSRFRNVEIPSGEGRLLSSGGIEYQFCREDGAWIYEIRAAQLPGPPAYRATHMRASWWRRNLLVLKFQIEPDGRMYILSEQQEPPVEGFAPQPHAFPLVPRESRTCP